MILGYILSTIGIMGSIFMGSYILSDSRYNYSIPLTDHETMVLGIFLVFLIAAVTGVVSIIFSIMKKNNEDTLNRINSIGRKGTRLDVCPRCGINITPNTKTCPKCGAEITNMEGTD